MKTTRLLHFKPVKLTTGFSLAEMMVSIAMISVIALAVGRALNNTNQHIQTAQAALANSQKKNDALRTIEQELRWIKSVNSLDQTSIDFSVTAPETAGNSISITPGSFFTYYPAFTTWRITGNGGGFTGTFTASSGGAHTLKVTHLSSYSAPVSGGGFSPVTIKVNNGTVALNWDPAQKNSGSHNWETDAWQINPTIGDNDLEFIAGNLGTHYWISRLEIIDEARGTNIYADFQTASIVTGAGNGINVPDSIYYNWDSQDHILYRSCDGGAAAVLLSDVYNFNLVDDTIDVQGETLLQGLTVSFEIGPDGEQIINKYIPVINTPTL